ncbi:MAG: choline dehydrogenase, partial [Gammaproteobacteria bacterium]|nr:choline dehydrogenase [Gammaproteobacteria bacterium]
YGSTVPTLNDQLGPFFGKVRAALRYVMTRRGPLAMSVNSGGGFIRSDPAQPVPNLQLYFNPVSYTRTPLSDRKILNPDPFSAFLISFNSCRPTSRGELHVSSLDPRVAPSIKPNYLSTEHDLEEARVGCRLLRQIAATAPPTPSITRPAPVEWVAIRATRWSIRVCECTDSMGCASSMPRSFRPSRPATPMRRR